MVKKQLKQGLIVLGGICAGCSSALALDSSSSLTSVVFPEADMIVYADYSKTNSTELYKSFKKVQENFQEKQKELNPEVADFQEVFKKFGFTEESIEKLVLSVDLDAFSPAELMMGGDMQIKASMAANLAESFQLSKFEEAVKVFNRELDDESETVEYTKSKIGGVDVLKFSSSEMPFIIVLGLINDGRTAVLAMEDDFADILGALKSGKKTLSENQINAMASIGPHAGLAFVLSDAMKEKLNSTENAPTGGNPMYAMAAQSFKSLQNFSLNCNYSDVAEISLALNLGKEQDATQLKMFVDNFLVSMLKMGMLQVSGGKPMAFLDTIKTSSEGSQVGLSFAFTAADLEQILMFSMEQQKRAKEQAEALNDIQDMEEVDPSLIAVPEAEAVPAFGE